MSIVTLTTDETMADVERAHREDHHVIGEDTARMIASWYHSPAEVDIPITALSHGVEFDAGALVSRVGTLIDREFAGTDSVPELEALRDWAATRTPVVVITTWEIDADTWETWSNEGAPDPRPTGTREVLAVSEYRDDVGGWVSPGEPGYPADLTDWEVQSDGDVWLPATLVHTASGMLGGTATHFYAGSRGGDPFDYGPFWEQTSPEERGDEFASRYIHPHTGEVEIKVARVHGFTPEEIDGMTDWKRA